MENILTPESDILKHKPTDNEYFEFRELLTRGNVNPSDYVRADIHEEYLKAIAYQGLCVEELIELDNPELIKVFIETELAEGYYEKWKDHPDMEIRYLLAESGHFPEHFINDEEPDIKLATVNRYPELIPKFPQALDNSEYLSTILDGVYKWTEFDPEIGQMVYDKAIERNYTGLEPLELKLKAMSQELTPLEKTMTNQQMYDSGSPLWARNYTPHQIQTLYDRHYLDNAAMMREVWRMDPKLPSWYIDLYLLNATK